MQDELKKPVSEGEILAQKVAEEASNYSHQEQVKFMRKLQELVLNMRASMAKEISEHIQNQQQIFEQLNAGTDYIASAFQANTKTQS